MAYTVTLNMPLKMPVPGTREPAQVSLLNENSVVLDGHDHTPGKGVGVSRVRSGLEANRPAFGQAGQVYFATDTGQFYVDTGSAWATFITTAGQSTVSGWTLVDPIIRDTLNFGAEGTGAVDTILARTAPLMLRLDRHLGLLSAPPNWHVNYASLSFANNFIYSNWTAANTLELACNSYVDAAGNRVSSVGTIPASLLQLSPNALDYYHLAQVATGATQTPVRRLLIDGNGIMHLSPVAGQMWISGASGGAGVQLTPNASNARLNSTAGNLELGAAGLIVHPTTHNTHHLGYTTVAWVAVYSVSGFVQVSSMEAKENVHTLDPAAALAAVRSTPVVLFNYKAPEKPDPLPEDYQEPPTYEHAGYDAATADPLLVMDDGHVSPQNTASVLLAAVQELLRRVEALESKDA